jgi:hypothetical protein
MEAFNKGDQEMVLFHQLLNGPGVGTVVKHTVNFVKRTVVTPTKLMGHPLVITL